MTWLGRKIFRRDQLDDPAAQSEPVVVGGRNAAVAGSGEATEAAEAGLLADVSADWRALGPTPIGPPLAADGKLEVAELLLDRSGAASPFGDDQMFPLPPERLRYQHPSDPEMDE